MSDPVVEIPQFTAIARPRLLDVRDADAFAAGHADGAVRVPIERWVEAARSSDTSFADLDYWRKEIAALGLRQDETAIIYDGGQMTEAARVWFILQYFGGKALVLNGGWPTLRGAPATSIGPLSLAGDLFRPRPDAGDVGLVTRAGLRDGLARIAVFDARTAPEFSGADLRKNTRGGHLPGARLLPHAELLEAGYVKSADQLRTLIDATGFRPGDHIVTHCDGGGRAALAAIAAVRAGFDNVNVYYLSFSDWAKDESCPVMT